MRIGATCAAMLRLPLTSALLATLLVAFGSPGTIPLTIVAVVVAFVLTVRPAPGTNHAREQIDPKATAP